ncbi:hypothetical protein L211DRAFT_236529 [Terfezia boudieri ATCC MYA-4762]|uniref:Uncharacterized protein n=1 Tax=Terfezia boudieri ATCC MYA-4762 TaxID=1051890 RepID=A0A3N4L8F5_9PEZI|nr:hypothetical protein L211DRAFT_236529 [Terfezia boudieri ATCC MYA-4762]
MLIGVFCFLGYTLSNLQISGLVTCIVHLPTPLAILVLSFVSTMAAGIHLTNAARHISNAWVSFLVFQEFGVSCNAFAGTLTRGTLFPILQMPENMLLQSYTMYL